MCPLKSPGWPMHELLGPGTMTVDHWMQSEVMMQSHMEVHEALTSPVQLWTE